MEDSPTLEFEFFLAQKLSTTVDELRHRLSADEFMHWQIYYGRLAQEQELAAGGRR